MIDRRLGSAIRAAREQRKLTQVELAARCGISRRHLAAIESGANLSFSVLAAIAGELREVVPVVALVLSGEERDSSHV